MQNNLTEMLKTGQYSDLKIVVGSKKVTFNVHKVVLLGGSGYFRKACSPESGFKEAKENVVALAETDPDMFKELLNCMYGHPWNFEMAFEKVGKLCVAAGYFDVRCAKACVINHLVHNIPKLPVGIARSFGWDFSFEGVLDVIKEIFRHYSHGDLDVIKPLFGPGLVTGINLKTLLRRPDMINIWKENGQLAICLMSPILELN